MDKRFRVTRIVVLLLAVLVVTIPSMHAYAGRDHDDRQSSRQEEHEHESYERGGEHDDDEWEDDENDAFEKDEEDSDSSYEEDAIRSDAGLSTAENGTETRIPGDVSVWDQATLTFADAGADAKVTAAVRMEQNRLFVEIKTILEKLNDPFVLYPDGKMMEGFANGKHFIVRAGKSLMYIGGVKTPIGGMAFVSDDGRLFVPLEAAAAAIGRAAVIDPQTRTIEFK